MGFIGKRNLVTEKKKPNTVSEKRKNGRTCVSHDKYLPPVKVFLHHSSSLGQ